MRNGKGKESALTLLLSPSFPLPLPTFATQTWSFCRAVATFFVAGGGGHYRECRRQEPCGGLGYPPPEHFQIWRLLNAIFSTSHERCLRKIDLEYENGKQLQVTIIKITESNENKSIHRLDVSGSTGPGGQLPPYALPPPNTLLQLTFGAHFHWIGNIDANFCGS